MFNINFKRLAQIASPLLGLFLFGFSIWAIANELRQYHYLEIVRSLQAIPKEYLLLALVLTILNYFMLTGYDALAVQYIRHPLSYPKTALAAVISYAVSNSIGFALLTGSAIRYRFYSNWKLSAIEIGNIIAFCNLSFWLGLFAAGGLVFVLEPLTIPTLLRLPFASVHPIGVIFLLAVVAYLVWNIVGRRSIRIGKLVIPHLPARLSLAQIFVTSFDWALAGGVLYALLLSSIPLSYPGFFGIYMLAQIAALISNVPGGLGVFETVILLLLSPSVSSATLFGALLAYRGIYYFLPLGVAVLLLGIYELHRRFANKSASS